MPSSKSVCLSVLIMTSEENEVFSGSVNPQPQMVNVQPAGTLMYVEKSSAPQVLGILIMCYGGVMGLGALSGLFTLALPEDIQQMEGVVVLPTWLVIGQTLTGVIISGVTIYAGFQMYSYKKRGMWFALGAIFVGWITTSVWNYLSTDYAIAASPDANELGGLSEIMAGGSAICGLFCAAICSLIVIIPLFLANNGME